MKTVNVLMSTYNGEKYIREQIESVLNQYEVQVILTVRDDGSTDDTINILKEYERRGKLTWTSGENLRTAKSFMELVDKADDFDFYAFCDQDDIWLPEKLIKAVSTLEKRDNKLPMLYCSDYQLVDSKLNPISGPKHTTATAYSAAIIACSATGCTVVFNRALRDLLKEYKPRYQGMHDSWVGRVCLAVGGIVLFDAEYKSILYRQHGGNVLGGVKSSKLKRLSSLVCKIKHKECVVSRQAQELLNGYGKYMSADNLRITELVADYKQSPLKRMRLLFSRKISPGRGLILGAKLGVLFGFL